MKALSLQGHVMYMLFSIYNKLSNKPLQFEKALLFLTVLLSKKELKIMIADDDADDRDIFVSAVSELAPNITTVQAKNGNELMQYLQAETSPLPDLLFLDLNMPLKSGHECLKEIRADERLKNLPVIIYSTSSSRQQIEETFENGASLYFPKPNSLKELKANMKSILEMDWNGYSQPQKNNFVIKSIPLR